MALKLNDFYEPLILYDFNSTMQSIWIDVKLMNPVTFRGLCFTCSDGSCGAQGSPTSLSLMENHGGMVLI